MKVTFLHDGNAQLEDISNDGMMTSAWRNFAGVVRPGHDYDHAGEPYFNIALTPDIYDALQQDGWDVRSWISKKNQEAGKEPTLYLKVTVDVPDPTRDWNKPSKIWYLTDPNADGKRRKLLIPATSQTFKDLDTAVFDTVDITIRPWVNKKGLKRAYLETMYYILAKDEWGDKWGDVEDATDYGASEELPFGD